MKILIIILITLIFFVISFWLGESGKGLFQSSPYIIGLIGMVIVLFVVSKSWGYRIAFAFLFVAFYAVTFYLGNMSFSHTYNTCINDAEQIRTALSNYKIKNGSYPDDLKDLTIPLPCSRILRGSIIEYEKIGTSYKLSFRDWMVEHSATDKEPFVSHK